MLMPSKDELKAQKKLAKADAKAAKKGASAGGAAPGTRAASDLGEGDQSADRAERDLRLNLWRVIFAGLSVLVALVSLIVLLMRS